MRLQGKVTIYFLLLFLAITWGTSFILIKKGLVSFSPLQLASLRLTFAGIALLPLLIRDIKKIKKKHMGAYILVAIFGNLIPYFLFAVAETKVNSSIVGALNGLTPFFTIMVAFFAFKVSTHWKQWIGIVVGLIGAVTLMTNGDFGAFANINKFSLYAVVASFCYAISVNTIKSKLNEVGSVLAASVPLGIAMVLAIPIVLFSGTLEVIQIDSQAYMSLGYILILGIFGTAIAIILFNRLIQLTSAVTASSVTYLIPLVAFVWGWVDGEDLVWQNIVGLCLILSGVYLVKSK